MRVNTIPEYKVIADDGHAFRPQIVYVDPESEKKIINLKYVFIKLSNDM